MTRLWPKIGDTIETVKPMNFTTPYSQAGEPLRVKIETGQQAEKAYRLIQRGTWRIVEVNQDPTGANPS